MTNHQYCPSTKRNVCLTCGKVPSADIHKEPTPWSQLRNLAEEWKRRDAEGSGSDALWGAAADEMLGVLDDLHE